MTKLLIAQRIDDGIRAGVEEPEDQEKLKEGCAVEESRRGDADAVEKDVELHGGPGYEEDDDDDQEHFDDTCPGDKVERRRMVGGLVLEALCLSTERDGDGDLSDENDEGRDQPVPRIGGRRW